MRYTIGVSIEPKHKGKDGKSEGLYALGFAYMPYLLKMNKFKYDEKYMTTIMVFDDIETATIKARSLSRAYRRDDVAWDKTKKSKSIRRFYPIKIDSQKFPFVIEILDETEDKSARRSQTYNKIVTNEYNEKCEDGMWLGEYKKAKILGYKDEYLAQHKDIPDIVD